MISPFSFALLVAALIGFAVAGFAFDRASEHTQSREKHISYVRGFTICLIGTIITGGMTIVAILLIILRESFVIILQGSGS